MIHIFESKTSTRHIYLYISSQYISSNFDSLEQLVDVAFDDPDKVNMPNVHWGRTQAEALASMSEFFDISHIATVDSLNNLFDNYPELFL